MAQSGIQSPAIRQGWLRVILFFVVYFLALIALALPAGMLVLWIKREEIKEGQNFQAGELLSGEYLWLIALISLLATLLVVFIFRKWIDRRSMQSLGFPFRTHRHDAATGFFLAPLILGLGTLILVFSGHLVYSDILFEPRSLAIGLGTMVLIAAGEEIAFRGYILSNLMDSFKPWLALVLSAILFSLFHLGNSFIGFLPLANIFLAGLLLGINYIHTRNLWFAFLFHLAWNFLQGPLLGYKVSGISMPSLLQAELSGGTLLTGGEFGFEGSVLDMLLTLVAILLLYWVYEHKYRNPAAIRESLTAESQT